MYIYILNFYLLSAVYKHCHEIKQNGATYNPNGNQRYAIDPDDAPGVDVMGVTCDFNTDNRIGISVVRIFHLNCVDLCIKYTKWSKSINSHQCLKPHSIHLMYNITVEKLDKKSLLKLVHFKFSPIF